MTEIVRFEYGGTTTSFYETTETEILKINRYPNVQKIDLSYDDWGRAFLYKIGKPHEVLSITFNLIAMDGTKTIDKLKILYDYIDDYRNPARLKCYWKYLDDTSTYLACQMKREMYREFYDYGQVPAKPLTIDFIECPGFISVPVVDMYNMPGHA